MTPALKRVFELISKCSGREQDALAAIVMEEIAGKQSRMDSFVRSRQLLDATDTAVTTRTKNSKTR
jgi:hypothetical protein